MTNFQRVAKWHQACGKTPNVQNLSVGVGVDLEEFSTPIRSSCSRGLLIAFLELSSLDLHSRMTLSTFYILCVAL